MSSLSRFPRLVSMFAVLFVASATLQTADGKRPIRKLKLDPQAPVVGLFEGTKQGIFQVRVSPKNPFELNVFITNTSDEATTVALPKSVAAVHVFKQLNGPNIVGAVTQDGFSNETRSGPGQSTAGTFSPAGQNNSFPGGPFNGQGFNGAGFKGPTFNGQNFFSIPPKKVVQIRLNTVCLDHGKPNPKPKMTYQLRRLEEYTTDPVLRALVGNDKLMKTDRMALQAAAWHVANGLSWRQLAQKKSHRLGGLNLFYFSKRELKKARKLVGAAQKQAKESTKNSKNPRVVKKSV